MRLRLGRPDISRYRTEFAVPAAGSATPLAVTFLGVSTLLLDDGTSAVLTDGYFSRPSLAALALGRLAPNRARIRACLDRAGIDALSAVVPVHTHVDHALDTPAVAGLTAARLLGGESAANVARGYGLPEEQIGVVADGAAVDAGAFSIRFVASRHCPPDRYPGAIDEPVRYPARVSSFRCGEAWSLLLGHRPSGRRLLIQGSAGFRRGALTGEQAEVAYLGVGQLGVQPDDYIREYWAETVAAVGARRVVLTHWDDFFRPLDRPLRALPYAGDDLDRTMKVLTRLADRDGVRLWFPCVWQREDPWGGRSGSEIDGGRFDEKVANTGKPGSLESRALPRRSAPEDPSPL